jgi:hypothetical protein
MAHVDVGSRDRAFVLEQEGEIRPQRGQQRADQPYPDRQRNAGHRGSRSRISRLRRGTVGAVLALGAVLARRAGDQARTHELALLVVEAAIV